MLSVVHLAPPDVGFGCLPFCQDAMSRQTAGTWGLQSAQIRYCAARPSARLRKDRQTVALAGVLLRPQESSNSLAKSALPGPGFVASPTLAPAYGSTRSFLPRRAVPQQSVSRWAWLRQQVLGRRRGEVSASLRFLEDAFTIRLSNRIKQAFGNCSIRRRRRRKVVECRCLG